MKVFLDANIFIAAAGSPTGGSAYVLRLAHKKHVQTITVLHALLEAEKNIRQKMSNVALTRHYENLSTVQPIVQLLPDPTDTEYNSLTTLVPPKDVPILLGALYSEADILITLDRRDFLDNVRLRTMSLPFKILSPGDFLQQFV